VHTACTASDET